MIYKANLPGLVHDSDNFIANTRKLIQCCNVLSIPIVALEQNPRGLGSTTPEIAELLSSVPFYEKHHFNAMSEQTISQTLSEKDINRWLVAGIEAHICVYQTVLGLLDNNYQVDVVSDCIASRAQTNKDLALNKMHNAGAEITSLEMRMFELMKTCQAETFKSVLQIIK